MTGLETRPVGRSGLRVATLGLGTAPLGDLFVRVSDEEAHATLEAAVEAGVMLIDTAPYYGYGLSEHRVGRFVRSQSRDRVVVATKAGRVLFRLPRGGRREDTSWVGGLPFDYRFDYSYDGVVRSYEDSLQRMGLDRVELLAIHDLDVSAQDADAVERGLRELASGGGARALEELRASGDVRALGLGINALGSIPRVLDVLELDYVIVAMPYTLLCERHGVSLAAAALRFALGHPAVTAVIPGAVSPDQVRQNAERFATEIPRAVWSELKDEGLLRADAPTP